MDHWGVTEVGEKRRGIRVGLLKTKALNLRECGDQECTERYTDLGEAEDGDHHFVSFRAGKKKRSVSFERRGTI